MWLNLLVLHSTNKNTTLACVLELDFSSVRIIEPCSSGPQRPLLKQEALERQRKAEKELKHSLKQ